MFKFVILGTVTAFVSAVYDHPINPDIVEEIKAHATSWTPYEVHENPLRHKTREEILSMLGLKFESTSSPFLPVDEEDYSNYQAPIEFDARKKWGKDIHPIRDQQRCGSCWAFGAAESLSDRLSIATKGS